MTKNRHCTQNAPSRGFECNRLTSIRVKYHRRLSTMRTFPKALSRFREIVDERGQRLRTVPFEELKVLGDTPIEHLIVGSRPATIGIIVQPLPGGGVRVVVQGFMRGRLF